MQICEGKDISLPHENLFKCAVNGIVYKASGCISRGLFV